MEPWNKGKRTKPIRACSVCGRESPRVFNYKDFGNVCDRHAFQLRTHGRVLTDEEAKRNMSNSMRGKRPWNYKGGRYSLNMVVRRCWRYKQWVKAIFRRDDWTCQLCGVRGAKLEADHYPVRFASIMDEGSIKSYEDALACERLWDEGNGRTLCRKCHRGITKSL